MDKKTLHKISYGLYIICSKKDNKINGQIANAVFQVTAEPATIAMLGLGGLALIMKRRV